MLSRLFVPVALAGLTLAVLLGVGVPGDMLSEVSAETTVVQSEVESSADSQLQRTNTVLLNSTAEAVSTVRYEQTDSRLSYNGSWYTYVKSAASGGSYGRANTNGSWVTIHFKGTRLDWVGMKGTTTGKADVYLDGTFVTTIDLASSIAVYDVMVWSSGVLPDGEHTVRIAWNPTNTSGKYITLDAVEIAGELRYPPAAITGLTPKCGLSGGGTRVTISGTGLSEASAVSFGEVEAESFEVQGPNRIVAVAPPHSPGTVQVKVTTPGGCTLDTEADDYTYLDNIVPDIDDLTPDAGSSSGGERIVITGTGFVDLAATGAVTFGGVPSPGYTVDSDTQITAVTPAHVSGKVDVQVRGPQGTSADTEADDYAFLNRYDDGDSRMSYSGTWEAYTREALFLGSCKKTSTAGAAMTVYFTGSRLDWLAMMGSGCGKADVYLDDKLVKTVNLASSVTRHQERVWSTGELAYGVHKVRIVRSASNIAGRYITVDGVEVLGSLGRIGRIEQADSRLSYAGSWSTFYTSGASGGSYRRANTSGAAVVARFKGTRLTWIATKGPTFGRAWVSVDGDQPQSVDLSAPQVAYQQKVWNTGDLAAGDHEVRIWWDVSNLPGKYISIDALEIEGSLLTAYPLRRYEQTDARILFSGSWSTPLDASASGGSYKKTSSTSAAVVVTFTGTSLDWLATTGPDMGRAEISVDGGPPTTVDLGRESLQYKQKVWSTGPLEAGTHHVCIRVSGDNPAGASVNVDAFDIRGQLPSPTSLTSSEIKWVEQRLADLSFRPGAIDGIIDAQTRSAVTAFEKWEVLPRDGTIDPVVWSKLQTAKRPTPSKSGSTNPWIEVNKAKQVLLLCKDGKVMWTVPTSTGNANVGVITPSGTFTIFIKTWAISPCYLPLAVTIYQGATIAIHGYPKVPTYPASHGCIRTQLWDQDAIHPLVGVGTKVYIY